MSFTYPPALDSIVNMFCIQYISQLKKALISKQTVQSYAGSINGMHLSYATERMDRQLEARYPNLFKTRGLPFIELGANDGINQSNTLYFEHKYDMNGILMEALPGKYETLKVIRSNKNFFQFGAAVANDFSDKFIRLQCANLRSMSLAESGKGKDLMEIDDVQKHINPYVQSLKHEHTIYEIMVPAVRLQSVIDSSGWSEFSLLSLDTEGSELAVLDGIDFNKTRIKLILIETRNLVRMTSYLEKYNYVYIKSMDNVTHLFENFFIHLDI